MTCDEIAEDTGIEYRTVTPRIIQLERQGLVYRAGDTRKGRTGRSQLIVRSCIYLATIPVIVKPTKAKSEDGDQFLKGMIRATRIVAEQESVDAAISVLKREMIDRAKVASR